MGSQTAQSQGFKILPATAEDFVTLAEVESISNETATNTPMEANISRIMFGPPNAENHKFRAKGLVDSLSKDSTMRNYKAVVEEDGKEKIVAWASWNFYPEVQPIKDWVDLDWPATANKEACNDLIGRMTAIRQQYMSGRRFAFLQVLATLPDFRLRGIGSSLVRHGLAEAEALGLSDLWLTASADGHDLYTKYGFQDLESVFTHEDIAKYGGSGDPKIMAMGRLG
ncbi:uncharacterized protein N7484_007806 [Penicillium longicatenatum]|uniref:uncharacterized protein n=1 Tax=Penicillium longicatenatum TaxID=1561947 RepID=UPI00254855DA|nr:uncharacterized protein N7484_007806 [Penicillium longicatenatum]KAJ5639944.1 hypothetical protein N7484_007806 [Penicillium longicatenatum]